jgi:hypothetical protein
MSSSSYFPETFSFLPSQLSTNTFTRPIGSTSIFSVLTSSQFFTGSEFIISSNHVTSFDNLDTTEILYTTSTAHSVNTDVIVTSNVITSQVIATDKNNLETSTAYFVRTFSTAKSSLESLSTTIDLLEISITTFDSVDATISVSTTSSTSTAASLLTRTLVTSDDIKISTGTVDKSTKSLRSEGDRIFSTLKIVSTPITKT